MWQLHFQFNKYFNLHQVHLRHVKHKPLLRTALLDVPSPPLACDMKSPGGDEIISEAEMVILWATSICMKKVGLSKSIGVAFSSNLTRPKLFLILLLFLYNLFH